MSYFAEQQSSFLRAQGSISSNTMTGASSSSAGSSSTTTATAANSTQQRHTYAAQLTPGLGAGTGSTSSSAASSPYDRLPGLSRDESDDDMSPASSGVITPPLSPSDEQPRIASDHTMLHAMAMGATPVLVETREPFPRKIQYPSLLTAYGASKPTTGGKHVSLDHSPPHTPKGHPLSGGNSAYFPNNKHLYAIINPYSETRRQYTTTLSYLLRVPRRFRPLLMLGLCICTFLFVHFNRSTSYAAHIPVTDAQKHAMAFGRRYVEAAMPEVVKQQLMYEHTTSAVAAASESALPKGAIGAFKNTDQEMTALIAFITSSTANALPPLDPDQPLEPGTMLDFDPHAATAEKDFAYLENEIHAIYPLILMGKMRDPWYREIKKMLSEYKINPAPLIVDVDQRRDHLLFIPLISRILGTSDLPQLLMKGKPVGSYHEILELKDQGKLVKTLEASKAVSVKPTKPKKKGIKEAMRIENELVLGPKPIVDQ